VEIERRGKALGFPGLEGCFEFFMSFGVFIKADFLDCCISGLTHGFGSRCCTIRVTVNAAACLDDSVIAECLN